MLGDIRLVTELEYSCISYTKFISLLSDFSENTILGDSNVGRLHPRTHFVVK